jgi:hypothetical protein
MSINLQIDLPDALVIEARQAGLLESKRITEWLLGELGRKRSRAQFGLLLGQMHAVPGEPISTQEIQAEIEMIRKERGASAGGR